MRHELDSDIGDAVSAPWKLSLGGGGGVSLLWWCDNVCV